MELAHGRPQIVGGRSCRLDHDRARPGDLEGGGTGTGGSVEDQEIVAVGHRQGLGRGGVGLGTDHGLDAGREPGAVPVDRRPLLGIEVGQLHAQPGLGPLTGEGAGQGALPYPALLADKRHHRRHSASSKLASCQLAVRLRAAS